MQSGKKNWVFSFVFFTNSIKVVCLLIVTVTIKYFEFFTEISRRQRKYVRVQVNTAETKDCSLH